jgi:hypothetical protein
LPLKAQNNAGNTLGDVREQLHIRRSGPREPEIAKVIDRIQQQSKGLD